MPNFVMGQ